MQTPTFVTPAAFPAVRPRLYTSPRRCARPARVAPRLCARGVEAAPADTSQLPVRVRVSPASDAAEVTAAEGVWSAAGDASDFVADRAQWAQDAGAFVCVARTYADDHPVGAGRVVRDGGNARLELVRVTSDVRRRGVGRRVVNALLSATTDAPGAVYARARPDELGFWSIMSFEAQGGERLVEGEGMRRVMVRRVPVCSPTAGACVGLHHTSIRVSDIERSLAFYGSLGFAVTDKFFTPNGARACFVEGLGARLEFLEAPDGAGGLAGVQGVPPAGFDRLVFDVTRACTDLESYVEHLARRNGGALTIAGPPASQVVGNSVVAVATIMDVDGLPIEFIRREASLPSALRTRVDW